MKVNELEDKVMGVWSTCEDIDTFLYRYLDSPAAEMTEDDIANTLLGIKALHEQRCQRLWDAVEEVVKNTCALEGTASIYSPVMDEYIARKRRAVNEQGVREMSPPNDNRRAVNEPPAAILQADREPLDAEI